MTKTARMAARMLVVAAVAVTAVAVPTAAGAATISALRCESGGGRFICDVSVISPPPLAPAIRWTISGRRVPAFDNQAVATGPCRIGSGFSVSVWVGDPLHTQGEPYEEDTRTVTVHCRRQWQ